jgi:hypothetical protein
MPAYYTYLISSLPTLNFSGKAPFSLQEFFAKCKNLIPEQELGILRQALDQEAATLDLAHPASLKQWANFEVALRNELARARSARKKIDAAKYLRQPDPAQAQISHLALLAYRSSSILEAEKILDQARWGFLDELSFGHYFDFDYLMIYGLKLKILERWDKIQKADKETLLNAVV